MKNILSVRLFTCKRSGAYILRKHVIHETIVVNNEDHIRMDVSRQMHPVKCFEDGDDPQGEKWVQCSKKKV